MKVNIEIDCTPDEARTFLGLPYVKPLQDAVMASIERHMLDAAAAMSPDAVMKTWFSSMPQNRPVPQHVRPVFRPAFWPAAKQEVVDTLRNLVVVLFCLLAHVETVSNLGVITRCGGTVCWSSVRPRRDHARTSRS